MDDIKNIDFNGSDGIYIIDEDFHIVFADENLRDLMPSLSDHSYCYSSLRDCTQPCLDCPLQLLTKSSGAGKQILYNEKLSSWMEHTAIRLSRPQGSDCTLVSLKKIVLSHPNGEDSLENFASQQNMIELNLTKNTYQILFYDESKYSSIREFGTLQSFIHLTCTDSIYPDDQGRFLEFFDLDTLKARSNCGNMTDRFRKKLLHGGYVWVSFTLNATRKRSSGEDILLCTIVDVKSELPDTLQQMDDRFLQILETDQLTGLYTASAFYSKAENMIKNNLDIEYAIVSVDIEHFKVFNDWYGTTEGDNLLIYIADFLKYKAVQYGGLAAKVGGDDFVLLIPAEACKKQRLEQILTEQVQSYKEDIKFLPVIGVYFVDDLSLPVPLMCDRAALAVASIKGNYMTRVSFYDSSMKQVLADEQELLFNVRKGLENHEFVVYFQPKCNGRTGKIVGVEALVRWMHPEKGLISPAAFIPVLEKNGFISKLDLFVWEEVCLILRSMIDCGESVLPISVNLSQVDLYQYDVCQILENLTSKYDIPPYLLELEITESAYAQNYSAISDIIDNLRKIGFTISMDDFGSGYSSLNMLKDMEIDVLKIDMRFLVSDEKSAKKASSILESIIQMARWMELHVIVEGVETKEQMDMLLSMDCEYVQGYYFYRPMCEADFRALLKVADKVDFRGVLAPKMPTIHLQDFFNNDFTNETLLNNILGSVAIYETDGTHFEVISANHQYYHMTGHDPIDLVPESKHILSDVPLEDHEIVKDIFHRAEASPVLGASGSFRRYSFSGEIIWLHLHVFFLRKQGERKLYYGAVSNITDNVKLQKDLEALVQTTPGNIIKYSVRDGQVSSTIISVGLAAAHGYTKQEYQAILTSSMYKELLHPDDADRIIAILKNPDCWGNSISMEYRSFSRTGQVLWLEQHIDFAYRDGDFMVYNSLCTDITHVKKQEKELSDSQDMLQNILGFSAAKGSSIQIAHENRKAAAYVFSQSVPGGMLGCYCEEGFPIYFANDEIISLMGYDSYSEMVDAIDGKIINTVHPEDISGVLENLGTVFTQGKEYILKYRLLCKNQCSLWVINKGRVVRAEDGRLAIISVCMDINDTILAEQRLEKANLALSKAKMDVAFLNQHIPGGYHQCYNTPTYTLKHISQRFLDMFGYTRQDISTLFNDQFINMVVEDDRPFIFDNRRALWDDGKLISCQFRIHSANGIRWVMDQSKRVEENGEVYFSGIISDITEMHALKEQFETVLKNTPGDVFCIIDGKMVFFSYNLAKSMGYPPEEYKQIVDETDGHIFIDPRDKARVFEEMEYALESHTDIDTTFRSVSADNQVRYTQMKAVPVPSSDTGGPSFYGILVDVTVMQTQEHKLWLSDKVFHSVVRLANLDVWEYDIKNKTLTIFNDIASPMIGDFLTSFYQDTQRVVYDFPETLIAAGFYKGEDIVGVRELIHNMEQGINCSCTFQIYPSAEVCLWHKVVYEVIRDEKGVPVKAVGYFQDITSDKAKDDFALQERLLSQTDSLTGLLNRRAGMDMIEKTMEFLLSSNHVGVFMLVDVDNLKQVNDTYGHIEGDHTLSYIANQLKEHFQGDNVLCRLSGDAFLVFCKYMSPKTAVNKANNFCNKISLLACENLKFSALSVSMGISVFPLHGTTFQEMYHGADVALQKASVSKKNKVVLYDRSLEAASLEPSIS